ncbi:centromere protein F isoform X1 [Chelonia mydas]|uniref:centromere protein F isoform X1 n=1 Tax=Chelonia mydas TaxID=8469 RepID=UPI0018A1D56E|nr:centromere protein F isoform X1 [Chelonia mydas]
MSWVVEEWKEGLSTRALQKIQELESQLDKLKKERQQRQFQLESLEAALQKQKQKVENEKNEGATLKRENQSLMELCDNLEKTKQKISHDLQVKESQVNYQAGQLTSSKKQIERLEQELKRYKSELERSQQTLITGDLSFSSTPQKNFAAPLTPNQNHNDSKFEELQEKYNKEIEERKRLEAELRNIQIKKINHSHPQSTKSHREIARHQASSSVFSWQQEKTPSCPSSSSQETPLKRGFTSSHFPWEQEATPSHCGLRSKKTDFSNSFSDNCDNSSVIEQLKTENQELSSRVQELEHQLQDQEKEKKFHMNKLQETQLQLEKTKLEFTDKDSILHKIRDELNRMTAQRDQATAQYEMVEQKMKKLSEELNCQRQNAESARRSLEQKVKEKEKEYQKELFRQQHSLQTVDQQCNQIKAKLNQDLQQAKNDNNALRAELDKAIAVKQRLENNSSELSQKLCRAEQALLANQSKENDMRRNFEEMKKEKNLLRCQSDQKSREIHQLEEQLKTAKQFLKESQNYAEEMKNKSLSQEEDLKILQEKLNKQDASLTLEKLKLAIADLEKQRDSIQHLLKQRESHTEELNSKISKMEKESEALLKVVGLKEGECEELKKEFTILSQWKNENEQLVNKLESEKEELLSKINDLESFLKIQQVKSNESSETVRIMVNEKEKYSLEIKNLRDMVEYKSEKLEAQKKAYDELQQKAECSDQKYRKEIENMTWKISQLTNQVEILEQKLQLAANEVLEKDQCYHELHGKYEKICYLVKSKDISEVTEDRELNLQNKHCRTVLGGEEQLPVKNSITDVLMREPGTISEDWEDHCAKAVLETDKNDGQDMSILQDQVSSLEISLMAQKQFKSLLQKPYENLVEIKGETEKKLVEAEQMHGSFVTETKNHIRNLQGDTSAQQDCIDKTLAALEEKDKQLHTLNKELETQQAEIWDLKINNKLLEDSVKQLQLVCDTWNFKKKDMSTMLSLREKEIEDLTEENGTLKGINKALEQEKVDLLETNIIFSNSLKEREESISELSRRHKEERLSLIERYEEIEKELVDLQGKYKSMEEKNANTEGILRQQKSHFQESKAESERQEKQLRDERNEFFSKLVSLEGKNKDLIQELEKVQSELQFKQSEIAHIQNVSSAELDCLRQEMLNVRAEQNKMQEEHNVLLQENEQLSKVIKTKNESLACDLVHDRRPTSEQLRVSMEEKENELNKYQVKLELLQMDLEDREVSVENYSTQVMQLEAALKSVERKLEESEKEKERMQQELQTIKEELETPDPKLIVVDKNDQSVESVVDADSQVNSKREIDEKYSLVLHELTTSQNDDVQLVSSLQMTMNRLNELEKMCEMLQIEKLVLTSELNDSKTECTTTDKMAEEVEKIVSEVKILKDEKAIFPDELMDQNVENEVGIHFDDEQMSFKSLECSTEPNYNYEDLKLSNKEVKMHFAEVKEKIFSLQREHKILHEQHCSMIFKVSELQSCIKTLKAENSALSTSLNKVNADSVEVQVTSRQKDGEFKLEETKSTFSPSCLNEMPYFPEANLLELSFDSDLCKWREESIWLNISQESVLGDKTEISLVEEPHNDQALDFIAKRESIIHRKSNLESKIRELQMICQTYEKSIKSFEEQFQSRENMKNEIQELKQLIISERKESDDLRKQNISDNEQWQQKLSNVTMEMEYKLAAEKKQIEHLSLELEVARLQLQGLDLSSRSLLCIDIEDTSPNEQENNGEHPLQVHSLPNENLAPKREKPEIRLCEQITIEKNSECENVAEVTEARSAEECPAKLISETEYRNTLEKKTDCHSESSFSNHNISLTPLDFLENQVTIETLQLQIKQTSSENLKLLHGIEESNKKVDALLMEIKELNSRLDLQHTELTAKVTAYAELEKTVLVLKKENSDLNEKFESVSFDKHQIAYKVMILEKELDKAKSDVDVYKVRLSDVTDMLEDLEMTKGDWHEKFLQSENELRRTKSEKENIQNHALSIEGDIEELQRKNQQLEKDSENKLKTISTLQEQLAVITRERNQLSQELSILSENKEELDQLYQTLQEKIKELESNKVDATEFIRILEAEAKTQTKLLQTTKSDVDQLSREKDYLVQQLQNVEKDAEVLTLEKEKLQNQMQDLEEEKKMILGEPEMLQTKLSESEMENSKLSKTLEGSLIEKGELAARLNSTQEEVDQLRYGIEKLKMKIESDEKKRRHTVEKLKESERKADFLLDKTEKLERELQMSEENLEDAILQAETANTETETLKIEMEEMAERLKSLELAVNAFRSEKEGLTKELQEKQEKISELESSNSNIVRLLEEKEKENMQIKEESENVTVLIKSQLKNASEEIKLSFNELEICKAKEQDLIYQVGCLEHDKTQLLLELQEVRNISTKLEQSLEAFVQELADCKQTLDEKIQENGALQKKIKDVEQLSVQLSHAESERECWKQEKEGLQNLIAELKQKVQHLSNNEILQTILENLKASHKDLEKELESTLSEKNALVEKIQLDPTTSEKNEPNKSLDGVQKELEEKKREMKREISEYQSRLLQVEKNHQALLAEANRKNEVEIQACQEKLNSLEQCLSQEKLEMELLKSSKEELNNSLKDANQTIEELKKIKVDNLKCIVQLKKQNEFACSKMEIWMKSCKQLKQEKEMLQKQIAEHGALLKKQKPSADEVASAEEMRLKLEELKESLEEKTKEAEENLEKYCTLIIKNYKLEEENEMLKTQVSLLSAQLKQPANAVNSPSQNSDNPVTLNNQSVTEKRSDEDPTKLSGKRQRCQKTKKDDGEPKSPIPETLSKKMKKGAFYQHSLTHENTEYEPDGLPEVVKKGFADIPVEKISPYVLRRTTLNLRTSPRLAAQSQRLSPSAQSLQKGSSDNLAEISKLTAGGSKSQKVADTQQCQAETAIEPMESSSRSPLRINKQTTKAVAEICRENLNTHKGRCSLSTQTLPDQNEQEKNCMVQ